jgi:hypothetical protein
VLVGAGRVSDITSRLSDFSLCGIGSAIQPSDLKVRLPVAFSPAHQAFCATCELNGSHVLALEDPSSLLERHLAPGSVVMMHQQQQQTSSSCQQANQAKQDCQASHPAEAN